MSTADYQRAWRAKQGARTGHPGRPITKPCGTPAAYKRHIRNGEKPCDACRAANTEKQAELRARRKATG